MREKENLYLELLVQTIGIYVIKKQIKTAMWIICEILWEKQHLESG